MRNVDCTLAAQSLRAAKWNYLGNGLRMLLQFVFGVMLARLLGPHAYGIVAIGWLMVGIGLLVADFGFSAAVIQRKELSSEDLTYVFSVQVLLGAGLTALGLLLAYPVAACFHQLGAVAVVQAMALTFLIRSLGQTAVSMLNRELRYDLMQSISIASYVIGFGAVGITSALLGAGVWSLVAAQLTQVSLNTAMAVRFAKTPMRFSLNSKTGGISKFGGFVVGANLSSWLILNLDAIFIGHVLGATTLGLYNRAVNLVNVPSNVATTGIQSVLFSAGSRAQGEHHRLRSAYLACSRGVALCVFPVLFAMAAIPSTLILALYGAKWAGAVGLVTPLALAMAIHAVLALIGPVLMAENRVERELQSQFITALVAFPVFYLASRSSAVAVAWCVLGVYVVRLATLLFQIKRTIAVHLAELVRALSPAVVIGIMDAVAALLVDRLSAAFPPIVRLAIVAAASAFVFLLISRLVRGWLMTGPFGRLINSSEQYAHLARLWLGPLRPGEVRS